ncbi:P-loop NTPase [Salinispira pacifica]
MTDPRVSIIRHRLGSVATVLAFASGKGGVGKSCCSTTAALLLAREGRRVGLLDLDFHGASTHLILGIEPGLPAEQGGILPFETAFGLQYMGIAPFTGDRGVALRGDAVTDAILELLAVVIWGELDVLVIDMPPGIGEAVLDIARYVEQIRIALVSTASMLSLRIMERLVEVLDAGHIRPAGCILNMGRPDKEHSAQPRLERDLKILGTVPYVPELEEEIGKPDRLVGGRFAAALAPMLGPLITPS